MTEMWGNLKGLAAAIALVALSACGSDTPADQLVDLANDYCACQDDGCREAVRAKVAAFDKSQLDDAAYEKVMEARDTVDRCASGQTRQSAASSAVKKSPP